MGFDVLYLPPIHPIGVTNRKGPNNTLVAGPDDPGSPWAIGNEHGGFRAVDPNIGTLDDFLDFQQACHAVDIEIALDFALNCSPDHPYIKEHPEWFLRRPRRHHQVFRKSAQKRMKTFTLFNYEAPNGAWKALWEEIRDVLLFWAEREVRTFRVDNPHTKSVPMWEWVIGEVQAQYPDTIFLAEAFTRPAVMRRLGKIGFTQSYTYFTWRNFKKEIIEYLTELTQTEMKEYYRGNFFANTPDILPEILQVGGRPAFKMRFALAATLSSVYGIYSSFELCEGTPIPGKEEYLNSEKYEIKNWDWDRPGNIKDYIAHINQIRREESGLARIRQSQISRGPMTKIFYSTAKPAPTKVMSSWRRSTSIPTQPTRPGWIFHWTSLILPPTSPIGCTTSSPAKAYLCRGREFVITLDPHDEPAHIFRLGKWLPHRTGV